MAIHLSAPVFGRFPLVEFLEESGVIQPYSTIQIDNLSLKIGLSSDNVETKLSEMILNKTIDGIIDQRVEGNVLILFIKKCYDKTADDVIESIQAMNGVINRLYQAAKKLN